MNVLMVTPTYDPIIGGAETAVKRLTIDLNKIGIHTNVMTYNMNRTWHPKWRGTTEISDDGFLVFKIPGFNWVPFAHSNRNTMGVNLFPGRFTHLFKKYDIIHFHGELSFPLFSYFYRKAKIFHFHGLDFDFFKRYLIGRTIMTHVADIYISLTNQMTKDLVELGLPEHKIRCLPNTIDANVFTPSLKNKEDNLLLFVGRINQGKGLHVLLKSLRYLRSSVKLAIVGPSDWDSEYFNYIQQLIHKENNMGKHRVEYIGKLEHNELVNWYQRASLFVLPPTKYEALGIVNLEALSCETPVIATKVGGIPEVVHNGENGLLVEPNDAVELAKAIQYLLDNGSLRGKFGKEGRQLVLENYSNEIIIKNLSKIYEELS